MGSAHRTYLPHAACVALLLLAGVAHAQAALLTDDFEDAAAWQPKESRANEQVVVEGVNVEVKSHRDSSRPGAFLRISDHSSRDHWFWLHKRRAQGCWDLSRAATVTVWARSSGARTLIRFLVGDERGNIAYFALGDLASKDWAQKSLDLRRTPPFNAVGTVDWRRVALIGLRTDAAHGYTFDFDDLRVEAGDEGVVAEGDAERLLRPAALRERPVGFLASVSSADIHDSIVAVNLTGHESERELDLLAEAGVKWAKLNCFLASGHSPRTERLVDALLARRIAVLGHLPQALQWSPELFPDVKGTPGESVPIAYGAKAMEWFKGRVRDTAERFKGRIRVWEIGNEPDIAEFWKPKPDPTAFGQFVIETSKALKAADPQNKVINGGVCGFYAPGFPVARDFLTSFLKTGAGAQIDILGLHPYRVHPESGAPNMTQRQAADEVRKLMAEFGVRLPLWDTEWQITGKVSRAEVPFATDLYQAKSMLRKYLVESSAGFIHMNWQIAKARPAMDHPGQIFTADGRATAKYVALRHTGALFARLEAPVEAPLRLASRAEGVTLALLRGRSFHPSSNQATRMDTAERWRPVQGASVLEVRGALKGDGCEVTIHPTSRDALGNELPPPASPKKPLRSQPTYTPICLRFHVEPNWHDFGLRMELPKGGTAFLDDVTLLYYVPPSEVASFAFGPHGSQTPVVFFWTPAKPSDQQQCRAVDVAIQGMPAADYVLLDTLTGECRRLPNPRRDGDEAIFDGLPLCDYPMAIAPRDAFPTSPAPAWLTMFADAAQIVDRSFQDRTGDFYLSGFWRVVFDLAERLDSSSDKGEAVRRMRSFWRVFAAAPKEVTVKASEPVRMTLRPAPGAWHDSVANPSSKNVNRYFHALDDADRQASVHGVKMAGRALPQRPWADSPDNAYTWFTIRREAQPTEVFVVVPETQAFDGRDCEIDLSLLPRGKAILLSSRTAEIPCIAYWTDAIPDGRFTLALEAHAGWPSGAAVIDPRRAAVCGEARITKGADGARLSLQAPPSPQPLLLAPRQFAQQVTDALQGRR